MPEIILFTPKYFEDDRGWFAETYNANREKERDIPETFVQDNQSFSRNRSTIRGIHFQLPPKPQAKLVRCTRGSILDYVVDLRQGSPTFGVHIPVELSSENRRQLYIPLGFGHAFITLEDNTEVSYKASDFYSAELDAGIRWDCPRIGINWPIDGAPTLSAKDENLPLLNDFESPFQYDGIPLRLKTVE